VTLDNEQTGHAPTADATEAPAKAPARRRRSASRPAGPPQVDVAAPAADPTAAEPVAGPVAVAQPEAAEPAPETPARTPRKRASRKKAAAEPPEVPVEQAQVEQIPAAAAPDVAEVSPEVAPAPEVAAAEVTAPEATEAAPAPARRRRTRKVAAAPEPAPEPAIEPEAVIEPEPELVLETVEVPADDLEPEGWVTAPLAAAPVIVMPLFQAPVMSAPEPRRRRAASRPAGPPVAAEPEPEPQAPVHRQVVDLVEDPEPEDPFEDDFADEATDDLGEDTGDDASDSARRRRRRRGGRGRRGRVRGEGEDDFADADAPEADEAVDAEAVDEVDPEDAEADAEDSAEGAGSRRRRRRRRRGGAADAEPSADDPPNTVVRVREARRTGTSEDDVTGLRGSTRLEAKKQRRREGREAGRRRPVITEAEFLARRESVERIMVVREREGRTQIGVLEDGVLVEHYVARRTQTSMVGNVYLGRVQNVLPSMEAAFVDVGKGRNAVLYAGEVNWDAAGLDGQPKRIEHALKSGESVLVQVTKDPIGHKGARLTSQISLPGRYLVYVPDGSMTGISRKLPDTERARLKKVLREVVPENAGVIVRTAAEGASEEELARDVTRLQAQWEDIKRKSSAVHAPALLYGEPDLAIRVVRDIFNEDFSKLIISGGDAWDTLQGYIGHVAPDLVERLERWPGEGDAFSAFRIDEQLAKGLDRKVWLPSGGSLVIDRTEAMTVVDVNTGKFTGSGGNLEETVTKNNLEAAEEIVRQLRLRDIGGIIVVDFIDMVLESNRDLVLRRLLECLGRDRTKHQVAEVTSLGLVQMTRKRVGSGLLEVFSETCEHCGGRGVIIHDEPVEKRSDGGGGNSGGNGGGGRGRGAGGSGGNGGSSGNGGSGGNGSGGNGHGGNGSGGAGDKPAPAPEVLPAAEAPAPEGAGEPETPPTTGRRRRRATRPAGSGDGGGDVPALVAGS